MNRPLDFGVFVTPFHSTGQSPTGAVEYDMERVVKAVVNAITQHTGELKPERSN
jgi:hypothetical protein